MHCHKSSMSTRESRDSYQSSDLELQKLSPPVSTSSGSRSLYHRLEDSDEIRLLYLQPRSSEPNSSIRCSIRHVRLSETLKYEALSYMWGFKKYTKPIYVDGLTCHVRKNLWSALYHLRLNDDVRALWIDAICVNQDNIEERNYQVTQMGRIYSLASRVVIWLGTSDSNSALAISVLSKTGHDSDWASFSDTSILCPPPTEKGIVKLNAIRSLCDREYWTRLWIIQEVLLASDILICCGSESLPWTCLSSFFALLTKPFSFELETTDLIRDYGRLIAEIDDSIPAGLFREASKRRNLENWSQRRDRSLFGLCLEFGEARCEDRRDKIFGLHGFAQNCCRMAAPIDYTLSWLELYSVVLIHYILQHTDRKLLGDDILYVIQDFHQKLELTTKESIQSMPSRHRVEALTRHHMGLDLSSMPIKFRGNVRGRVQYVSSLRGITPDHPNCATLAPFLQIYISQLHFIENLHPYQLDQQHRVNSQIDLVWSADLASARINLPVKPNFPNYIGRVDPQTGIPHTFQFQKDNTAAFNDNIVSILEDARIAVRERLCPDATLAFEENGLICFGPRETRAGDLICQFLCSDILAVIRPSWRGYTLIGRAVSFLTSEPGVPFQALPIRKYLNKDFDVKPCEVLFEMDVMGLQMMTRASKYSSELGFAHGNN